MATPLTPGHLVTQSEQYFGGVQLAISIDRTVRSNWTCTKCDCDNMGTSKHCGSCGELNEKYVIKPKNMHKQSMVKKERIKLLTSRDIFKRLKTQFPEFKKYQTTKLKRRKCQSTHKNRIEHLIDNLNLSLPNLNEPPDTQHDTLSFIDSIFGNINFSNPFGVETHIEDNIAPTIIDEDDDDQELTITPDIHPQKQPQEPFDYEFGFLSLNDDLPKYTPTKHQRTSSQSAPNTPPSRRRKATIRINSRRPPLLIGVIHAPAPSKKNRLKTVFRNVKNLTKYKYDGAVLINHGYSAQQLVPVIIEIHKKYPSLWLGANFMGIPDIKIFKFVKSNKLQKVLKAVWCENAGIALDPDALDDIFVHNFYNKRHYARSMSATQELMLLDDTKEDIIDLRGLQQNISNRSVLSATSSAKSAEQKRVTFSVLSKSLLDSDKQGSNKPGKITHIKQDDEFARTRLLQIKKYKFNGLYFGGVDLKSSDCIKIPTQKSIRTRRRTYSSTDVTDFVKRSPRVSPLPSPRLAPVTPKASRTKPYRGKSTGPNIAHGKSVRITQKSSKNGKNRSNSIKLKKSLSTNTPIQEDCLATLAELSSDGYDDEDEREDRYVHKKTKNGIIKKPKSAKFTKTSNITRKWKNKNKNKMKRLEDRSMTDTEMSPESHDLLKAMDTALSITHSLSIGNRPKKKIKAVATPIQKMHQLGTPPMDHQDLVYIDDEDEDDKVPHHHGLVHSLSMPPDSYERRDSVSRSSLHSFASDDDGDAYSIYSQTSQRSDTWSEFGSMNETLDDYFAALHKLGRFAAGGYMHVITTSGKGKNIDIKLKALYEACSKKCLLAVASGVRFENIETFLPYVDILMVSTCISQDFHVFDPRKMKKFKQLIEDHYK